MDAGYRYLQQPLTGTREDFSVLDSIGQGKISLPESGLTALVSTIALEKLDEIVKNDASLQNNLELAEGLSRLKQALVENIGSQNRAIAKSFLSSGHTLSEEEEIRVNELTKTAEELHLLYKDNLEELKSRSQVLRFDIIKFTLHLTSENIRRNILHFGNKDQSALIEIAKIFAQLGAVLIVITIIQFGIMDQTARIAIAKLSAQENAERTARYIQEFGIQDPAARIEIAKLCAQKEGGDTAKFIQKFDIQDPAVLIEVAKVCAQDDAGGTAKYIQEFGITDQAALIEIAMLCAQRNGGDTAENITNFGIQDPAALIEIAKLCAQRDGGGTAAYIKRFGIQDQSVLIVLAKLCAQQNGGATARNIYNFVIEDSAALIEIAKLCAQQNARGTAENIDHFSIQDQAALIEIAKLCAQQDGGDTAENIKKFGIKDLAALIEIAKLCAQQNGGDTAEHIRNFGIKDPAVLMEIAKLCAAASPTGTAYYIDHFQFEPQKKDAILLLCCLQEPKAVFAIPELQNHPIFKQDTLFFSSSDRNNLLDETKKFIQEKCPTTSQECLEPLKNIVTPVDVTAFSALPTKEREEKVTEALALQKTNLELLLPLLWLMDKKLPPAEWPKILHLFPTIMSSKRPDLKWPLLCQSLELAGQKECPTLPSRDEGWMTILKVLSARLLQEGYSEKQIGAILERASESKAFKDGKNQQALHEALLYLLKEDRIDMAAKQYLRDKLIGTLPTTVKDDLTRKEKQVLAEQVTQFLDRARQFPALMLLATPAFLSEPTDKTISQLLEEAFRAAVPLGEITDFEKKYSKTIAASREPTAFFRFTGKLVSLQDKDVLNDLSTAATSILNNRWLENRHDISKSHHLTKIGEKHGAILEKWFSPCKSFPLSEITVTEEKSEFSYQKWLKQKLLDDRHMGDLGKEKLLIDFLQSPNEADRNELQKQIRAKGKEALLANRLITLSNVKNPAEEVSALQELWKLPEVRREEFHNDIEGRLQALVGVKTSSSDAVVIDTEAWIDLLLAGYEIAESCQRIDGDPKLNKGLLGYLLDGKIRMIAIKTKEGPEGTLIARALLKLLWDGEKPVLFLERIYDNQKSPLHKKALIEMAKRKAKELGIPLVSLEEGTGAPYNKTLESLEGPASFEYSDASKGVMPRGIYTISGAKFVE